MTKVLITGITGSGGSYLAEYLLENVPDVKIYGTTRDHSSTQNLRFLKDKVSLQYLDLTDALAVYRMLDETRPDVILHIASIANVRKSFDEPISVVTNNVNITLNLLECVRLLKSKFGYDPVIQICSTSEVYGSVPANMNPISETCPLKPINPYAVSKMTQDNLGYVYYLNYGLKVIRTRMFTYLNARRADLFATAFGIQLLDIKAGKRKVLEHGSLSSIRTIIDVREAAEAYWIATQKCKVGEVYNIGGKEPIDIHDFLVILIDKMGLQVEDIVHEEKNSLLRPSDISVQIPDMTKFTNETGWSPKISLDESINYFIIELHKFWDKK